MTARFALAWLLALCALTSGCERHDLPVPVPAPGVPAPAKPPAAALPLPATGATANASAIPAAPDAAAEPATHFAGSPLEQNALLGSLERADLLSFRPVGSTSTVFRTRLAGVPFEAAYKAASHDRPLGPLAEVAAYRLARCLGMDNVPPAVGRSLPVATLRERLDPDPVRPWKSIEPRLRASQRGIVQGAAIYWIPDLTRIELDGADSLARTKPWLRIGGELPPEQRSLAASLSTMLVFDYLIGNADRWSGGNAKGDPQRTRVYVRDHDLAFPTIEGDTPRLRHTLRIAERISRRFYASVRALTRERFDQELARDSLSTRLSEKQRAGVIERRARFLAQVQAAIAQHGEAAVLYFD